jgi:DNA/RNA-binding domain of Phe-tRNA-synthetase-like protein
LSRTFRILPEIFERLPGLRIAAVEALGIGEPSGVEALWSRAWQDLRASFSYPNAQSHPRIAAWRAAMKAIGAPHKDYPTSIESLVRRALKSEQPFRVNAPVDFYNAHCLRLVVPAGGFDIDSLRGDLELRLTVAGDTFEPLDGSGWEPVPPGEVAYADGSMVVTRHLMWRQSRHALIRPETRNAIFLSEALPDEAGLPERVAGELEGGLRQHFGAATRWTVLDADRREWPLA